MFLLAVRLNHPALSASVNLALIILCYPQGKGQQFHFKVTFAQNRRQSKELVLKKLTKIFPQKEAREI